MVAKGADRLVFVDVGGIVVVGGGAFRDIKVGFGTGLVDCLGVEDLLEVREFLVTLRRPNP